MFNSLLFRMKTKVLLVASGSCALLTHSLKSYSWRTSQPHQPLSASVAVINLTFFAGCPMQFPSLSLSTRLHLIL